MLLFWQYFPNRKHGSLFGIIYNVRSNNFNDPETAVMIHDKI